MIFALTDRFILVLDVETANTIDDAFVYDIGWRIIDIFGKTYAEGSFVIRDIFVYEHELMKQAFYAEKIPEYIEDIRNGKRKMINFLDARKKILSIMRQFNCHTVAAYNASFDRNALNTTLRFLTKSKIRYFFPYDTTFICIWNMACNSICQSGEYRTFAETNRYYSNNGKNYRATAEIVYGYLTNNVSFQEEHKGLDDVEIECEIFTKCFKELKGVMSIKRNCWQNVRRGALMVPRYFFVKMGRPDILHGINLTLYSKSVIIYIEKKRGIKPMREVSVFYAFDNTQFFDRDACFRYEEKAIISLFTINDYYAFFDKNMRRYMPPQNKDIEDWIEWFSNAAEHCDYIRVYHTLPDSTVDFINKQFGYYICPKDFHNETGLFKYEDWENEWVKVDEFQRPASLLTNN